MGGGRIAVACAALLALGAGDAAASTVVAGDAQNAAAPGDPEVAANPRRGGFVVAYTLPVGGDRQEVGVRRVDTAGRPVADARLVSEVPAGRYAQMPRLAYDPGRNSFLAVWIDADAPNPYDPEEPLTSGRVRARRLSAGGAPIGPPVTLAKEARDLSGVAVAYEPRSRRYAVVWTARSGVHARLLDSRARPVGGRRRLAPARGTVEHGLAGLSNPVVGAAPHARSFLAGWVRNGERVDVPLARTLAARDGRLGKPRSLPIPRPRKPRVYDLDELDLSYDTSRRRFALGWDAYTDDGDVRVQDVLARRMTVAGAAVGREQSLGGDLGDDTSEPRLAYASRPDAFMAVWLGADPMSAPLCVTYYIAGAPVGAGSWKRGEEQTLSDSDPRGSPEGQSPGGESCQAQPFEPDVAARPDGSGWLAVWTRSPYVLAAPVETSR